MILETQTQLFRSNNVQRHEVDEFHNVRRIFYDLKCNKIISTSLKLQLDAVLLAPVPVGRSGPWRNNKRVFAGGVCCCCRSQPDIAILLAVAQVQRQSRRTVAASKRCLSLVPRRTSLDSRIDLLQATRPHYSGDIATPANSMG